MRINENGYGSADIFPTKIGAVYPLEQALREPSSPYYLVGAMVNVNRRNLDKVFFGTEEERRQVRMEPATSLTVMVFMNDLMDYTRLEVNRLRRVQGQLQKKFTTQATTQEMEVEEQAVQEEAYPQEELNFSKS